MKKIIFIVSVVILLFIINNLFHSIYDLWKKQDLLTSARKNLEEEKLKNQKLKAELSYVKSREFIESEARNKLFLSKPKEQEVIIPDKLLEDKKPKTTRVPEPNWKKWLKLFF